MFCWRRDGATLFSYIPKLGHFFFGGGGGGGHFFFFFFFFWGGGGGSGKMSFV